MLAASISIDLDDLWAYRRSFGIDGPDGASLWPLAVPRFLALMGEQGLRGTAFAVGRDAEEPTKAAALRALAQAGHEIANHSWSHAGDLEAWDGERQRADLRRAHEAITNACGVAPRGFRAPSFRLSASLLEAVQALGYAYDSSAFHNRLAGWARRWQQRRQGRDAASADGHGQAIAWPLQPFDWQLAGGTLLELPVTTLPLLRWPVHGTYVMHLAAHARPAARGYVQGAAWACRAASNPWHLLLHATDFIGSDDGLPAGFLPGMGLRWCDKQALLRRWLRLLREQFEPRTMLECAADAQGQPRSTRAAGVLA